MEFTYTATLAVAGEEEAYDVWKAAEYLQMQEAIKALNNKWAHTLMFVTKCCWRSYMCHCQSVVHVIYKCEGHVFFKIEIPK